jgi:hypothetical protein
MSTGCGVFVIATVSGTIVKRGGVKVIYIEWRVSLSVRVAVCRNL